jgi:PPK2 family polyphosphate:nucleotide phosphotransferase
MASARLIDRYRIDHPGRFHLERFDPADTGGMNLDKADAKAMLADDVEKLGKLQEKLYAQDRWAVLVILQGMDTAGKDGVIKHVMEAVNPQGCVVHSFKAPSAEELEHDFLWRAAQRLPERGRIGLFNRSYYEEVLVVRAHPELLDRQKLPDTVRGKDIWKNRFKSIRGFEHHLVRNGTLVLKFFLHISKEEQSKRLLARIDEPGKRWKFSDGDIVERKLWHTYMAAYQDMIRETSRPHAPWHVVPADHKPFARLVVASAMVDALSRLDLKFPKVGAAQLKTMEAIKKELLAEGDPVSARRLKRKEGHSSR